MAEALKQQELMVLTHLGYTLYKEGQYEKAITLFKGLSELQPAEPRYHSVLAVLYHLTDQPHQSATEAVQALKSRPDDIAVMITLSEAYVALNQKNHALQVLNNAYQLARQNNHPSINRIYLMLQANR